MRGDKVFKWLYPPHDNNNTAATINDDEHEYCHRNKSNKFNEPYLKYLQENNGEKIQILLLSLFKLLKVNFA